MRTVFIFSVSLLIACFSQSQLHSGKSVFSKHYLVEFRWWDSYHGKSSEVYLLEKSSGKNVRSFLLGEDTFFVYRVLQSSEIRDASLLTCCEKGDLGYEFIISPNGNQNIDSLETSYDMLISKYYSSSLELLLKRPALYMDIHVSEAAKLRAFIYRVEVEYCACLPAFSNLNRPSQDTAVMVSSVSFRGSLSVQEKKIFKEQLHKVTENPVVSGFIETF